MVLRTDFFTHPTWNAISHSPGESTYRMVRIRIKVRVTVLGIELSFFFFIRNSYPTSIYRELKGYSTTGTSYL